MPRLPRLEMAGLPHLMVQAVVPGERLWRDDLDAAQLHQSLVDAARQHGVSVHAYVLLGGHFHLLATPAQLGALGTFMQAVARRYVALYNRRHGRQGGLWAGRFRGAVLDPAHYLLDAMVFLELHPWRCGLVRSPLEVARAAPSSLAHHLGHRTDPLVQDHAGFWSTGNTPFERQAAWRRRLEQGQPANLVQALETAAHKGWALGAPDFVAQGQAQTARRLVPRARGRPRKVAVVGAPAMIDGVADMAQKLQAASPD